MMICLTNVSKTYINFKNNRYPALRNVSLTIEDGDFIGIIGKSGSGKTTLLNICACLDDFDEGEMTIDGKAISKMNDKKISFIRNDSIGTVLQDFALIEERTVLDNVMLPLLFAKRSNRKNKDVVKNALHLIGIDDLQGKKVLELSGGQKQRVAIARAIVNNPRYVFADEPPGALDSGTCEEIMHVFYDLNRRGVTIFMVTHDRDVLRYCNRIIHIADGKLIV